MTRSFILSLYEDLTLHIVPGPQSVTYFVPVLVLYFALLSPPSVLSHQQHGYLVLPMIHLSQLHAWFQMGCVDVISVLFALWSFVLLSYRDPRKDFVRLRFRTKPDPKHSSANIDEGESREVWEEPFPSKLSSRVAWVFTLMLSFRFTNWKIGDPIHDDAQPSERLSRVQFLRHALISIFQSYMLQDLAASFVQLDPYFSQQLSIDVPLPPQTVADPIAMKLLETLPPRLLRTSVIAAQAYSGVNLMFFLPTVPAAALNALRILPDEWSPHTWPVFFGPFSAVRRRGLRGLWGTWWHQMNRHIMSTPGRSVSDSLGFLRSSTLAYACLVVSAFFFSGVLHMGLIPPSPFNVTVSANALRLHIGAFFWSQIPGFAIELLWERFFQTYFSKLPGPMRESFVIIWVMAWLSLTLPLLAVPFRVMGCWDIYPVPISPVQWLMGKGWLTY